MKIGAEDKKKLYAMLGLLAVAVLLLARFFTSFSPGTTVAASIPNPVPGQANAANRGKVTEPPLDPTLRVDLLRNSEGAEYKGSGRNIFEEYAEPVLPKIKTPVVVVENKPPPPPPPAPPPPIPLKFYGFANKPGQPKSVFLANGDDIFIGREGDIVNRRYKIVRIQPTQVEIEDVLNNNRQTIPLTPS